MSSLERIAGDSTGGHLINGLEQINLETSTFSLSDAIVVPHDIPIRADMRNSSGIIRKRRLMLIGNVTDFLDCNLFSSRRCNSMHFLQVHDTLHSSNWMKNKNRKIVVSVSYGREADASFRFNRNNSFHSNLWKPINGHNNKFIKIFLSSYGVSCAPISIIVIIIMFPKKKIWNYYLNRKQ